MKKITASVILAVILASMAGCSSMEKTAQVRNHTTQAAAKDYNLPIQQMLSMHDGEVMSPLTGEWIRAEAGMRRPLAVMLSNVQSACPQTGISRAGVVYEAPVEGALTRLMGLFEDYDDLEKIGSVRSCRNYYVYYAAEFDAVYAHYGQAAYALPLLESTNIDNLSGLEAVGRLVYYRTSDRKAPHNAYASAAGIGNGIENKGYRTHYEEGHTAHYQFTTKREPERLTEGIEAAMVKPGYQINQPWFTYSEEEEVYYRFQYGGPQVDDMNGEQLSYKNIIFQYSDITMFDQSYLNINTDSGGSGKYITNGRAIDITWKKDSEWGITRYYDLDGQEIKLNKGKTWVCIIQDTKADNIELS